MSFYVKKYNKKANQILTDAIKSALYIDENAIEPFTHQNKSTDTEVIGTALLSKQLYSHFKKNHISLLIHRFIDIENTVPFLSNKDLVLLDWLLDGEISGGELALQLLNKIIEFEHLHFCCIYTNNENLTNVLNNCISYFSGRNNESYQNILEEFEDEDDFISKISYFSNQIFALQNLYDNDLLKEIVHQVTKDEEFTNQIVKARSLLSVKGIYDKLRVLSVAYQSNLLKANDFVPPQIRNLDKFKYVFTLNNTVVFIINKDPLRDKRTLVNKIRNELTTRYNSFLLILGIELQNHIKKSCAFISGDVLDVKNETLAYHWSQNSLYKDDPQFKEFFKQIMIDYLDYRINQIQFNILDKELLWKRQKTPTPREIARINTFYNGIVSNDSRYLSFGDIFIGDTKNYYLCITALCDCLHPADNIKYKYFFVKGKKFPKLEDALELGDESFISYINDDTCISWVGLTKPTKIDRHKPVYTKPVQLYVPNPLIKDKIISAFDWYDKCPLSMQLEYLFTLRSNYAQRIANHAFSHPIRVGIDFVKRK
jgi:hypothetical protein